MSACVGPFLYECGKLLTTFFLGMYAKWFLDCLAIKREARTQIEAIRHSLFDLKWIQFEANDVELNRTVISIHTKSIPILKDSILRGIQVLGGKKNKQAKEAWEKYRTCNPRDLAEQEFFHALTPNLKEAIEMHKGENIGTIKRPIGRRDYLTELLNSLYDAFS